MGGGGGRGHAVRDLVVLHEHRVGSRVQVRVS